MSSRQYRVLALIAMLSGLVGGALSSALLRVTPAWGQTPAQTVYSVIRARQFTLVDETGAERVRLAMA